MLKKFLVAACLLSTSMASQATVIEYNGYKRDSASNIVTGGGLEWLKWDVTKGLSIKQALAARSAQGWRLASNSDVVSLFNAFHFGAAIFSSSEAQGNGINLNWRVGESSAMNDFLSLFGITISSMCRAGEMNYCYFPGDPFVGTQAWFGSDSDRDGLYKAAIVYDDYSTLYSGNPFGQPGKVEITPDVYTVDRKESFYGVALVRDAAVVTNPVNQPESISFLALGLAALGFRRRQAIRR
jgi:hypothetical protein